METLTVKKDVINIIKKYQQKDYFNDSSLIKMKISQRPEELKNKYPDQLIEKVLLRNTRFRAYEVTAKKIFEAIKNKDINYLNSVIRYDQKLSKELFELFTGLKLPATNKDIRALIKNQF